ECANRIAIARLDRERPAATESALLGQVNPRLPSGLIEDVPRQDWAARGRSQTTRKRVRTDPEPVYLLQIRCGHVACAPNRVQAGAIRIGDVEGSPGLAGRLFGNDAGEDAERFSERRVVDRCLERFLLRTHTLI